MNGSGILELNNIISGYTSRKNLTNAISGNGTINVIGGGYWALTTNNLITLSGQINIQSGGLGNDGGSGSDFGACTAACRSAPEPTSTCVGEIPSSMC